jgi:hypothetical protein
LKSSLPTTSRLGRWQKGGFIFLKKTCVERHGKGRRQIWFSIFFFAKNLCRAPMAKAVGKDGFLFF